MSRNKAFFILLTIFAVFLLIFVEMNSCNTKGSLAEKINWAKHNCK